MDPLTLAEVARRAVPLAGRLAGGFFKSRTVNLRVAWLVARAAKREGITISWGRLRRWLGRPSTQAQIGRHTPEAIRDAVEGLAADVLRQQGDVYTPIALRTLDLIVAEYLKALPASYAVAISDQRQVDAVATLRTDVLERIDASREFNESLRALPPWHAEPARRIAGGWPRIEHVIADLTISPERGALLRQWYEHRPDWLDDAPATALAWLGTLTESYGESRAAVGYMDMALAQGLAPRPYWVARAALAEATHDTDAAIARLGEAASEHPFAAALLCALRQDVAKATQELGRWEPDTPETIAHKAVLLTQLRAAQGDLSSAIRVASIAAEETGSTGAMMLASQYLLLRAHRGESGHRSADTHRALGFALRARDHRRAWRGDSADAVVRAAQAALMAGDSQRAWVLTQEPPGGEAEPGEASDPRVLCEAAMAAAMLQRPEQARTLAERSADEFVQAQVAALAAEFQGDQHLARDHWSRAWNAAVQEAQKLQAAHGLAQTGGDLPPQLAELNGYDEAIAEIQLIHAVLNAEDSLTQLRANAHRSKLLTARLAEVLTEEGNAVGAAVVLVEGANRWADPHMMAMAAQRYRDSGELDRARDAGQEALTLGGPDWPAAFSARTFLLELAASRGRWDEALHEARALVALESANVGALWALLKCLLARGDAQGAWQALTTHGEAILPREPQEAVYWVALHTRFAIESSFVTKALGFMRQWPDDEQLLAGILLAIQFGMDPDRVSLTIEQSERLSQESHSFMERFPESPWFRAMDMGPEDDPLAPFSDMLRASYEQAKDALERVQRGELPLGALAGELRRPVTELSLKRAANGVLAVDPSALEEEMAVARKALHSQVVADQTTAHTLAIVDEDHRSQLTGQFTIIATTDQAYTDALDAKDSLAGKATLSIVWDPAQQRPAVSMLSEAEAALLASRSSSVVDILQSMTRRSRPEITSLPKMPPKAAPWLSPLDLALDEGLPYWCDDAVLRHFARGLGVPVFGTFALIRVLFNMGVFGSLERDLMYVAMLRDAYFDMPFDRQCMEVAAASDEWRAKETALALTRATTWSNTEAAAEFVVVAISRCPRDDLRSISGWASAAATGLIRIAGDPQSAASNLEILLLGLLVLDWMNPAYARAIIDGVRASSGNHEVARDPLPAVLRQLHAQLVEDSNHSFASTLLMSLMAGCEATDRDTAARTILTAPTGG